VAELMLQAGIKKFKCATIAEAEMLALAGAPDVLLAYQPVGPKLARFVELIRYYPHTHFSCLVDAVQTATAIEQHAVQEQIRIPVFVDLNVGMNRSGIYPKLAYDLARQCARSAGLQLAGLHAYDGHIHDASLEVRRNRCAAAFVPVEELWQQLEKDGFTSLEVVAGGSPSFSVHLHRKNVTCSPGTFVYWDANYEQLLPEQPFLPAAVVVSRIISLPDVTTICTDLGHKSVASENAMDKRVVFLNAPELKPVAHSEEHLVLEAPEGHGYQIGDVLYGLPFHICPTIALYENVLVVNDCKVYTQWKNCARDRKIFK
jgi:D-threonine aldolase